MSSVGPMQRRLGRTCIPGRTTLGPGARSIRSWSCSVSAAGGGWELPPVVDLVDTHQSRPITLHLEINGRKFEQQLPAGASNDSIAGQPAKGRPFHFAIEFPAASLKAGDNRLHIRSVAGSWFLYDASRWKGRLVCKASRSRRSLLRPRRVLQGRAHHGHLAHVVNTMRRGIGTSWHAIEEPIPVSEKPHPVFPNKSHGGSG